MNPFGATGSVIKQEITLDPILKFPIRFHTNVMKYIGAALSNS